MRITSIEAFPIGAGWKNWVFVRVHTDEGISGVGEGTLNGFARTIMAAVQELSVFAVGELRASLGPDFAILIDAHARFAEAEAARVADALAPYGIYWFEEPTSQELDDGAGGVAARTSMRIATGETFADAGQFFALARAGGVGIWQPEPMSLGGIGPTMRVAAVAASAGAWIAPHQSGGPIATAICLQLAASVENFLIQERFDPFNEPWTQDLVSWHPHHRPEHRPPQPASSSGTGSGRRRRRRARPPYDPNAYLDIHQEGWEKRLGSRNDRSPRPPPTLLSTNPASTNSVSTYSS